MKKIVLLVAMALMVGTTQANLLTNPGFEDGVFKANNPPDSWIDSWTSYTSNMTWFKDKGQEANAHSGSRYIQMNNWWTGSATHYDVYLWQNVTGLTAGADYSFSVWGKSVTSGTTALGGMYMVWYNTSSVMTSSAAGYISSTRVDGSVGDTWTQMDFGSLTAPAGTVAGVFFLLGEDENNPNHTGTTGAVGIYYDDAVMIPEPATIGLLGLGALVLTRRRKA